MENDPSGIDLAETIQLQGASTTNIQSASKEQPFHWHAKSASSVSYP